MDIAPLRDPVPERSDPRVTCLERELLQQRIQREAGGRAYSLRRLRSLLVFSRRKARHSSLVVSAMNRCSCARGIPDDAIVSAMRHDVFRQTRRFGPWHRFPCAEDLGHGIFVSRDPPVDAAQDEVRVGDIPAAWMIRQERSERPVALSRFSSIL